MNYSDIIAFEADFTPYQPTSQSAVTGVPTFQFSHTRDNFAGEDPMPGAIQMDTSSDPSQEHALDTFIQQIMQLPQGEYEVINGVITPK